MLPRLRIPLFDGDKFIGRRTLSTVEALLVRGLVTVKYNKHGFVSRADCLHLNRIEDESLDERLLVAGTEIPPPNYYSYQDFKITAQPWDLRRLNNYRTGIDYTKGVAPADFLGVIQDCLR